MSSASTPSAYPKRQIYHKWFKYLTGYLVTTKVARIQLIAHRNNFHLIKTYNCCNHEISKKYIEVTNCKAKIQHEQKRNKCVLKRHFGKWTRMLTNDTDAQRIKLIIMKGSYAINNIYQTIRKVPHFYNLLVTTSKFLPS